MDGLGGLGLPTRQPGFGGGQPADSWPSLLVFHSSPPSAMGQRGWSLGSVAQGSQFCRLMGSSDGPGAACCRLGTAGPLATHINSFSAFIPWLCVDPEGRSLLACHDAFLEEQEDRFWSQERYRGDRQGVRRKQDKSRGAWSMGTATTKLER